MGLALAVPSQPIYIWILQIPGNIIQCAACDGGGEEGIWPGEGVETITPPPGQGRGWRLLPHPQARGGGGDYYPTPRPGEGVETITPPPGQGRGWRLLPHPQASAHAGRGNVTSWSLQSDDPNLSGLKKIKANFMVDL